MATAQYAVVEQEEAHPSMTMGKLALFNPDGTPYAGGGGGAGLNTVGFARAIYLAHDAVAPGNLPGYTQIIRLPED